LIFYTKNQTLLELKNNSNISQYISLLEILDETYGKTKVSLDENTTFLIGILKIVSGYKAELQNSNQTVSTTQTIPSAQVVKKDIIANTQVNPKDLIEKKVEPIKEEISHNDAFDVFGDTPVADNVQTTASTSTETGFSSSSFDAKVFIDILKKSGAK